MIQSFKSYLESIKITPISWLLGVSGVLMVRFFLESLSNPSSTGFFASDASTLIHYWLFFISAFVVYMILLQIAIPSWKNIAPQFVAVSSLIIFIAPIADWIISGGNGFRMTYFSDMPKDMIVRFFTFGGTDIYNGATAGLRIEMVVMILFFGVLVYLVQKNWKKGVFYALVLYLVVLIFASIPGIISALGQIGNISQNNPSVFLQNSIENSATISNNIHSSLRYSSLFRLFEIAFNFIMGKILFLISIFVASVWFLLNSKEKFKAMLKNSRPERVAHYFLMILLGLVSAFVIFPAVHFNWNDWLSVLTLFLSFYFSIMFAVCTNDIADEEIDKISDPKRPLVAKTLSHDDMKQSAVLFLVASMISAFLAGYTAFFFVMAFTALYYVYSMSPTRFKLIPFFSSFIIGLCSLTTVMAGFFLLSPLKQVHIFPAELALAVVTIFFFGSHIRDIKDMEGDKKAGVKTVPVIFGEKWGPRVVGTFVFLAFILVPIFSGIYILFITTIPSAVLAFYFVNRKPYKEIYIFFTYFVCILVSFLLLMFF